ncbi:cytochrome c, partial [Oleiagrimonas sp.]|uniref:c-type cytochrome n=1 Tax=Oleiagrimonas sp. TaxID=2010330 RepID=UPI00261F8E7A
EEDFWTALHEGKGRHGRLLYPAFPYTAYTHVKRADADAMYVYLRTLDPVHSVTHAPSLRFPFSLRTLLLAWRALYFDPGVFKPDPDKSAQWNRGAYLVKGLGHCSACHTARNVLGAQKSGQHLRGGLIPVEGWYAPGLGVESDGSLAGWSARDIHDLLKTGRSSRGTAYGPMADVVQGSLQYLDDKDLYAIADYLRSLPRRPSRSKPDDSASGGPLSQEEVEALLAAGKRIFHRRCSACHQDHGQGVPHVYPKLAGNSVVMSPNPVNCVRVVMLGGFEPTTRTYPRPYSMPPFMQQLSDRQVAAVVSYIRQSWGNAAEAVSPQEVRKYRSIPLQ